jgi:hypothetical protein
MDLPKDRNRKPVVVGTRVRLLALSGAWLEDLPQQEKTDVTSMIGGVFTVEEIDAFGSAWIERSWDDGLGVSHSHSIAPDPHEMEVVDDSA